MLSTPAHRRSHAWTDCRETPHPWATSLTDRPSTITAITAAYFCSRTLSSLTMSECQEGAEATVNQQPKPCKCKSPSHSVKEDPGSYDELVGLQGLEP